MRGWLREKSIARIANGTSNPNREVTTDLNDAFNRNHGRIPARTQPVAIPSATKGKYIDMDAADGDLVNWRYSSSTGDRRATAPAARMARLGRRKNITAGQTK